MLINLSELFTLDGKMKEYPIVLDIDTFVSGTKSYTIAKQEPFSLTITNLGEKKLIVEGKTEITLNIPCGRCLLDVPIKFAVSLCRELDMNLTQEERIEQLDEQPYIIGYNLDVDLMVSGELFENLPMKVLCDENCKGICYRCGTNLNHENCDCDITDLDPRMSVIRDIFKNAQD